MHHKIVFLRKAGASRSKWFYFVDDIEGELVVSDAELTYQIAEVVVHVQERFNVDLFAFVSPQITIPIKEDLEQLFPLAQFFRLSDANMTTFFNRAVETADATQRRRNQNVLYIGSDASAAGFRDPNKPDELPPAAWAWASDGIGGSYDCGFSGNVNVNVSELEGILNALVSNRDAEASLVHVYSDSANAVDMVNMDLAEGIIPREARKNGLVSLAEAAKEVMDARATRVTWVKGHRAHRLNMIADTISRTARLRYAAGGSDEEVKAETDLAYSLFNWDGYVSRQRRSE